MISSEISKTSSTTTKPGLKHGDVDRTKTCPFLLRIFVKVNGYHRSEEYNPRERVPTADETQIHTWKDATLREITTLIKEVYPEARGRSAVLKYNLVYPNHHGENVIKRIGVVKSLYTGDDDDSTLDSLGLHIGDYLDVALYTEEKPERFDDHRSRRFRPYSKRGGFHGRSRY